MTSSAVIFGRALGAVPWLALFVVVGISAQASADAPKPPRVASTSVCADEYVLMLADRSQIATVSFGAIGAQSLYADAAKGIRLNRGDLESVLASDAGLVVVDQGSDAQLIKGLSRLKIATVALKSGETFDAIKADLRRVAAAIGQPARGERAVADLQQRIDRLEAAAPPVERRPIVAYYRPGGGGAAAKTSVNSAIELGGFRNLQTLAGQTGWGGLNFEVAVEAPPQAYVVSYFDTDKDSLTAALGHNPILRATHAPVIAIPGKYWSCSGPGLINAAEDLARQREIYFPTLRSPR